MRAAMILLAPALCAAGASAWLDAVAPLVTPTEKKTYLRLGAAERAAFEAGFWTGRSIEPEEYFRRAQYVDAKFGSGRTGSGANTDQGRVYLTIGPPTRVRRIPSSRIFVPLEIWYYETVPGVIESELRLIFYQKGNVGLPKLYSPELDTVRALLLPQAGTIYSFGPNDTITEAGLRMALNVPPAEDEVIPAAVNVAAGIRNSGNSEILARVATPAALLNRRPKEAVESRLVAPARVDALITRSPYGGMQVDLTIRVTARNEVGIEVLDGPLTVYQNVVRLDREGAEPLQYLHRLDLLPGSYRLAIHADGRTSYTALEVGAESGLMLVSETRAAAGRGTPFEFGGTHYSPSARGNFAIAAGGSDGVEWIVRKGLQIVRRERSQTVGGAAVFALPAGLASGKYELEAEVGGETRRVEFEIGEAADEPAIISFNANLTTQAREAFLGHQWLLKGNSKRALPLLEGASELMVAQVDLARIEALTNRWDTARARLRKVLEADPANFDALCVLAYVETQLQDFPVAEEYYRKALEIQDSAQVRLALAQLPK